MDEPGFAALRGAALHRFGPDDWAGWYPRMAAHLASDDASERAGAVERLMTAAFWAEPFSLPREPEAERREAALRRAAWFLDAAERAHARRPDVLPEVLRRLRWHGEADPFPQVMLPWLARLRAYPVAGVAPDLVVGADIMIRGIDWDGATLPAALGHPSDYARACAAYALGRAGWDDPDAFTPETLDALTAEELRRPGIAGPFWSGWGPTRYDDLPFDPLAWMLDIIERRAGPEPDGMAFNGVDFHVHELADHSPEGVRRLLRAGRPDLAVMAATEERSRVEAMAPVLRELAAHPDPAVAREAAEHLARYHGELTPGADPARLRRLEGWRPGVVAVAIRQGEGDMWRDLAAFLPAAGRGPFDDAEAWGVLDAALPPGLRGPAVRHILAMDGDGPGPVRLGRTEEVAYASGALVSLDGDPDARLWRRLEVVGRGLQGSWDPFALGRSDTPE